MNISQIIKQYFEGEPTPDIATFDADNINDVCHNLITSFLNNSAIELTVLQSFNYCVYEVLDNVMTHSGKLSGVLISRYSAKNQQIQVLVADDGMGVHKSLTENTKYKDFTEKEALSHILLDKVTDGKGMGFGLFSTKNLITFAGGSMTIASGNAKLVYNGHQITVNENDSIIGTIVYLAVNTNCEINANDVVENRTDCAGDFNDAFLEDDDLNNLW